MTTKIISKSADAGVFTRAQNARQDAVLAVPASGCLEVGDQLLYALYLTGRIGLWFAFAGLFLIYALTGIEGRPTTELGRFRWYFLVPISLATLQLLAGFALGRRSVD